ncbi:MAG: nucleotidyltransferase domain-containing protein [Candidatus Lokiarchaeota archaeon]|nr:nucleotidyltransferase domain-containing protein [Candidatus Lokiarchaeota archaeon]
MTTHHKRAIEKLVESIEKDNRFLALIIGGSVAKGMEREDSDIDVTLVATDEEFEKRKKGKMYLYYETEFCDYPGGYIDGKVVNLKFLQTVAERGSEPARDAFRDAWIAYSEIPELGNLLKKIPVFQKEEKLGKISKFYAQFETANWIIKEAVRRNDDYLLTRGITDLILFGGRLILEHNEILYPFHKLFMQTLAKAHDKPENLKLLIDNLLKKRNLENAQTLFESIKNFRKWEIREFWAIKFLLDTEWAWIDGKPYVGDL